MQRTRVQLQNEETIKEAAKHYIRINPVYFITHKDQVDKTVSCQSQDTKTNFRNPSYLESI